MRRPSCRAKSLAGRIHGLRAVPSYIAGASPDIHADLTAFWTETRQGSHLPAWSRISFHTSLHSENAPACFIPTQRNRAGCQSGQQCAISPAPTAKQIPKNHPDPGPEPVCRDEKAHHLGPTVPGRHNDGPATTASSRPVSGRLPAGSDGRGERTGSRGQKGTRCCEQYRSLPVLQQNHSCWQASARRHTWGGS